MILAYLVVALSCDIFANLVFMNIILVLIFFVSHPMLYKMSNGNIFHVVYKIISIITIDLCYLYFFIIFSAGQWMYAKIGTLFLEHSWLLNSFDEGLIVKTDAADNDEKVIFCNKKALKMV